MESSLAHYAAKLTYCAEKDSVLSWVVWHVEHRELGTTEEKKSHKEKRKLEWTKIVSTKVIFW